MSLSILYVDDDEVDRLAVARAVRTWGPGWEFYLADGFADGVGRLREREFDAVIADYRLKDGLGKDLVQLGSPWPLIIVTGQGDPLASVEALRAGAHDFITKDMSREWLDSLQPTIVRAVTRFRLERQLIERNNDIARLRQELGHLDRFSSIISNVLTIPLQAALHYIRLTSDNPRVSSDQLLAKYCNGAVRAATRCSDLLAGLRYYSRLESSGCPFAIVDSAAVATTAIEELAAKFGSGVGEYDVSGLPLVWADEAQLRELFRQLLRNALENHPSRRPNVTVSASNDGVNHRFQVSDDGPGIGEKYHSEVFLPFRTIGNSTERIGMGLAIAEKIVQRHGGQIWVESDGVAGAGCRFVFSIPVHAESVQ